MTHDTDFSKHTDEELREGIRKANENAARVSAEDSDEAMQALADKRDAMEEELRRREQS